MLLLREILTTLTDIYEQSLYIHLVFTEANSSRIDVNLLYIGILFRSILIENFLPQAQ